MTAFRAELRADCGRCVGLCCVALPFGRSADFAFTKSAGEPCRNLMADDRCGIHSRLREAGMPGCVRFDCFGAGQFVSGLFRGEHWRDRPQLRESMFGAFGIARWLHELLWYLADALDRPIPAEFRADALAGGERIRLLLSAGPAVLAEVSADDEWDRVRPLLSRTSALVRGAMSAEVPPPRRNLAGRDLTGADFRRADLRGTLLLGVRLAGADLRDADVLGADLRRTDLSGADLSSALFLTQTQVNAADGDRTTRLPDTLDRPAHWIA